MKTSKFTYGILCLIAVTGFAGVAMTQEDPFYTDADRLDGRRLRDDLDTRADQGFERLLGNVSSDSNGRFQNEFPPRNRQQVFDPENIRRNPNATSPVMRARMRSRTVMESYLEAVPPEEVKESRLLQTAIKSLNTSSSDVDKKKAADVIQEQLKRQFERDLKQREKELAAVEERVLKLRQQLDKRKAAQKDIINLRLQTLVNEANGLGFPANSFGGPAGVIRSQNSFDFGAYPVGTGSSYPEYAPVQEDFPMSDPTVFDPAETTDSSRDLAQPTPSVPGNQLPLNELPQNDRTNDTFDDPPKVLPSADNLGR